MGKNKENSLVIIEVCSSRNEIEFTFRLFQMKGVDHLSMYWNTQCKSRINLSFEHVIVHTKTFSSLFYSFNLILE